MELFQFYNLHLKTLNKGLVRPKALSRRFEALKNSFKDWKCVEGQDIVFEGTIFVWKMQEICKTMPSTGKCL